MKFDYIIGNPPYNRNGIVKPEHGKYFKDIGSTKSGIKAFMYKGIDLLKDDSKIIYIIPTGWMLSSTSEQIRNILFKNGSIESIDILPREVFNSVTIPGRVCIWRYVNTKLNSINITQLINNVLYGAEMPVSEAINLYGKNITGIPLCIEKY